MLDRVEKCVDCYWWDGDNRQSDPVAICRAIFLAHDENEDGYADAVGVFTKRDSFCPKFKAISSPEGLRPAKCDGCAIARINFLAIANKASWGKNVSQGKARAFFEKIEQLAEAVLQHGQSVPTPSDPASTESGNDD